MEFDNTLDVALPPADAWALLLDIKRVAACIPGAIAQYGRGSGMIQSLASQLIGPSGSPKSPSPACGGGLGRGQI